jgi:arylsulfatase A
MKVFRLLSVWLLIACAAAASVSTAASGCHGGERSDKPNVIVILADDLGWGDLGAYGATKIQTPNCDRLAEEGILFTDAHSADAVCSPSRYSVLTGRYAWRTWLKNGILVEHMPLLIEPGRLTLPAMFQRFGYTTGCIGKWHLGWGNEINADFNGEVAPGPLECGFDYFFGIPFSHQSDPLYNVYVENRRVVGLKPGDDLHDPQTLQRVTRVLHETASTLSAKAVEFIEHNKNRPFFLYYPTVNVHNPWTPGRKFRGSTPIGPYGDFVVELDWAVGEVLDALDRFGLTDRTLVVVTSDNGANVYGGAEGHDPNGPWRGTKGEIYEGAHRVPFIARWPGWIPPDTTSDETICLTDLMATCAAILHFELPHDAGEDSYNILPAMLCEPYDRPIREATVHHSVTGMFAIRQGHWKLIEGRGGGGLYQPDSWAQIKAPARSKPRRDPRTGEFEPVWYDFPSPIPKPGELPGQLYNLDSDPHESVNVWRGHPDVVKRLQELLDRYRREGRSRP